MRIIIALLSIAMALEPLAVIRTLLVDKKRMEPVYPSLGRSTVLRFKTKPQKVVLGNQNYYKIEFTENDLTIQPQGSESTNLFVYTKNDVFGFLLVPTLGEYDDLVHVLRKKTPPPPTSIGIKVLGVEEETLGKGLAMLSLDILEKKEKMYFFVAEGEKRIRHQKIFFNKNKDKAKIVFIPPEEKKVTLHFQFKGKTLKREIPW